MASQVIGGVVMCAWAAIHPSVWALVGGTIVSSVVRTAGSHVLLTSHKNWFAWDRSSARDILSFGKWILVGTMIAFAALQIDRLTLGRLASMRTLGLYSVALAIAQLPYMILLRLTYHVQHPILSALQRRSSDDLKARFFHIRGVMLLVAIALTLSVFAGAPLFFRFVYHANFQFAGNIAQSLCFVTWGMILSETLTRLLMVKGDSRSLAIYNFVRVIVTVEAVMAGYYFADIEGFVWGVAVGVLCGHLILQLHMSWHDLSCFRQDAWYTLGFTALAGMIQWIRIVGDGLVPWMGSLGSLIIPLAIGIWALRRANRYLRHTPDG
jgi:O-antigen/teichoic acid export membrane protein